MPKRTKRRIVVVALFVLVVAAGAAVVLWPRAAKDSDDYRTEIVDRGDVTMTVTATGTISAVTTVQVGSQVSGIIARLHADFNSRVSKGQLLAELDPTPFEAQVEQRRADLLQSEAQLRNAEVSYGRQQRMLAAGLTPEADFDAAKAAYDVALAQVDQSRASLRQTETNLRYTRITSPIDGIVVAREFDVGQTVAASFQAPRLFTIAQDLTKMQVQADVDQSDIGRVRLGQPARFTVDAYPEQVFAGQIAQIRLNATVSQNVITYPVIIEVANPEERLRPNMTADVSIEVDKVKDVLRIPNAALRFRPPEAATPNGSSASQGGGAGVPGAARTGAQAAAGREGGRRGGFAEISRQFEGAIGGGPQAPRRQTVYRLGSSGSLEPVSIRPGISDGRFTAVVEGEIEVGELIVTGLATVRAESSGTTNPFGGRGPGGRRGF